MSAAKETARELSAVAIATATDLAAEAIKTATELTVNTALVKADLVSHERVCAERYGFIIQKMEAIEKRISDNNTNAESRTIALSNRMWVAAGSLIGILMVGIASAIMLLIALLKHV